jgi:hypothetical protein
VSIVYPAALVVVALTVATDAAIVVVALVVATDAAIVVVALAVAVDVAVISAGGTRSVARPVHVQLNLLQFPFIG